MSERKSDPPLGDDTQRLLQARIAELEANTKRTTPKAGAAKRTKKELATISQELAKQPADKQIVWLKESLAQARLQITSEKEHLSSYQRITNDMSTQIDSLKGDLTKSLSARERLESLCRELQRHTKLVSSETKKVAEAEQKERERLMASVEETVKELEAKRLAAETETRGRMEEHEKFRERVAAYMEKEQLREEHFQKSVKAKELEIKLAEARLQQAVQEVKLEREKFRVMEEKYSAAREAEERARADLSIYVDNFKDFEETLKSSSSLVERYQKELLAKTKQLKTSAEEVRSWQVRWEQSNTQLLQVMSESAERGKTVEQLKSKLAKLEKLCRALQAQRTELSNKLEQSNEAS